MWKFSREYSLDEDGSVFLFRPQLGKFRALESRDGWRFCLMIRHITKLAKNPSIQLANPFDEIARKTDRPRSYIVQKALEPYIEEYADLQIALDRLHDSTDELISGEELRKNLVQ